MTKELEKVCEERLNNYFETVLGHVGGDLDVIGKDFRAGFQAAIHSRGAGFGSGFGENKK